MDHIYNEIRNLYRTDVSDDIISILLELLSKIQEQQKQIDELDRK